MSRFEVDSGQVEAAAARARHSAAAIHGEVAGMMTQLVDLESTWRGTAATSFAAVAQEWRTTQQIVEQSLTQITEALDIAARTYATAEADAQGLFAR